jgi:Protein of unknown function (DUF3375)
LVLRSSHAPIAVAVLAEHLAGDVNRRLAPELFALVDAGLEDLRAHGFELPDATQRYCRMRLNAGYLVHRTVKGATPFLTPFDGGRRRSSLSTISTPPVSTPWRRD